MKRFWWIILMAPPMWGVQHLVRWADRLHAWQYSQKYAPPTPADFTRAAVVFWASLLIPLLAACVAAFLAFRRKAPSVWPSTEASIIVLPYLATVVGIAFSVGGFTNGPFLAGRMLTGIVWFIMLWASVLVGGAVAAAGYNAGASVLQRTWGKLAVSMLTICAGMLYLFWLSGFIIYIDT